jgi:hypothetical protein
MTMFSLLRDFWKYAQAYRKFWMIPFIMVMLVAGGAIVLATSSAVAPFIYALF